MNNMVKYERTIFIWYINSSMKLSVFISEANILYYLLTILKIQTACFNWENGTKIYLKQEIQLQSLTEFNFYNDIQNI